MPNKNDMIDYCKYIIRYGSFGEIENILKILNIQICNREGYLRNIFDISTDANEAFNLIKNS